MPYIGKALQDGMTSAQIPFDRLNDTASQNQKIQTYKDEKIAKDNYAEFSKGLGVRADNDTYQTVTPDKLNSNLIDQDGNQIAPSMMDSSYNPEGSAKDIGFFNKKKYLDKKLAEGKINLEQYNANLPKAAEYMAVGDRVFNKTAGEYVDGAGMSVGEEALDKAYAAEHLAWERKRLFLYSAISGKIVSIDASINDIHKGRRPAPLCGGGPPIEALTQTISLPAG